MMSKNENVAVALKPIFYFTKLCGLTPFNSSKDNRKVAILNLVWCSLNLVWIFLVMCKWLEYDGTQERLVVRIVDFLALALLVFSLISSILKNYFEKYKILKLIAGLSKIDNSIKTLNFKNCNAFLNYKKRKMCFLTVVTTILIFILILAYFFYIDVTEISYFYHVTLLIPSFVVMQFYAIILLIKDRFALLNNEFAFVTRSYARSQSIYFEDEINSVKIENILILHGKLVSLSKSLNKIYGVSILALIAYHFLYAFELCYYILVEILYENVLPFVYVVAVIYFCGSIFAIIIICSLTMEEANKIRTLVEPIIISENQFLNLRVTNFYLQLLEDKLNFTACGLFALNKTLIHGIFSSIISYAIILWGIELELKPA